MQEQNSFDFEKKEDVYVIKTSREWRKLHRLIPIGLVWLILVAVISRVSGCAVAGQDKSDFSMRVVDYLDGENNQASQKIDGLKEELSKSLSTTFDPTATIESKSKPEEKEAIIANLIHEGAKEETFEKQVLEYQFIAKSMENRWKRFDKNRFATTKGMIYGRASKTSLNYSWTSDKSLPIEMKSLKKFNENKFKAAEKVAEQYLAGVLPENNMGLATHYITPQALLECKTDGCAWFKNTILKKEGCLVGQRGGHIFMALKVKKTEQCTGE